MYEQGWCTLVRTLTKKSLYKALNSAVYGGIVQYHYGTTIPCRCAAHRVAMFIRFLTQFFGVDIAEVWIQLRVFKIVIIQVSIQKPCLKSVLIKEKSLPKASISNVIRLIFNMCHFVSFHEILKSNFHHLFFVSIFTCEVLKYSFSYIS